MAIHCNKLFLFINAGLITLCFFELVNVSSLNVLVDSKHVFKSATGKKPVCQLSCEERQEVIRSVSNTGRADNIGLVMNIEQSFKTIPLYASVADKFGAFFRNFSNVTKLMGIPTIDQNYGKRSRADALIEQNSEVHASNIPIPPRKTLTITQKIYQCKFNGALVVESRGDTEENFVDIANETRVEEPKKPVYAGEAMHSMANQQLVTLDKWNRLVANKAFTPGAEGKLDKTEIFLIEKGEDGLVSIKSAQNGRYVWMESDLLMAECNISVKGCVPAKFNRVCYENSTQATTNNTGANFSTTTSSTYTTSTVIDTDNNLRPECELYALRSVNGRLITVELMDGEDYGVLKATGPSVIESPFPYEPEFYTFTFGVVQPVNDDA